MSLAAVRDSEIKRRAKAGDAAAVAERAKRGLDFTREQYQANRAPRMPTVRQES